MCLCLQGQPSPIASQAGTDSKGYASVPSQPAAPANFSLMDLMSSLAEPGPGVEKAAGYILGEEQLTAEHWGWAESLWDTVTGRTSCR